MTINPLPSPIAASIAGSDRAVAARLATSNKEANSTANINSRETVDSIDKGNASEDSGADGRQTLDTFERQNHDEESDSKDTQPQLPTIIPTVPTKLPSVGTRLDFKA